MRTLVFGDVHGSAKALQQVLERSKFNPEEDKLISLGDIADGWSEVPECVDILLDIQDKATHKPVFIRGNHDVWAYDWFMMGEKPLIWTQQGGQATINAYIRTGDVANEAHRQFWKNQIDWYIDDENRIFVHAGWYHGDEGPIEKKLSYKVNAGSIARECHWDRSLLLSAKSAWYTKNSFKALDEFKEIYIGHTATSGEVENYYNLWNLDAGAGFKGRLAIMDVETKEIWYSDMSFTLYPDEMGRM